MAENKKTKKIYAIKVLKKGAVLEENDVESIITERNVLVTSVDCVFLTHIAGTFQTAANLFFVMEMYTGGPHPISNFLTPFLRCIDSFSTIL